MKNILLAISLLVSLIACGQTNHGKRVIGTVDEKGNITLTADKAKLTKAWINGLIDAKVEVKESDFELLSIQKQSKDLYVIMASGKDSLTKTLIELVLVDGNLYELLLEGSFSTSVTCNGCAVGCHPKKEKGIGWICWPVCTPCTKIETVKDAAFLEYED